MEQIVNLHIEHLPEGVYLATSDDIPGLVLHCLGPLTAAYHSRGKSGRRRPGW